MVWTQGIWGMLLMLAISLPMYVCATASVPLAASLIVAGMSPGSALVLLMAGPTTNVATMGAIYRAFGQRVLAVFLGTVIVMSISLGLEDEGLGSMAIEMKGLLLGGAMFLAGVLIERRLGTR